MSGQATKKTVRVAQDIGTIAVASDFCACAFSCDYVEKAFAGSNDRENDKSSFLYAKKRTADTIVLELHRKGRKVANLNGNTYGTFYPTFSAQPLYVGFVIDWGLVFAAFGGGEFEVIAKKVIFGQAIEERSRKFAVNSFDEFSANGTVKVEFRQSGNVLSSAFDYTDLVTGGWPNSYRIPASFGQRKPTLTTDSYESSDRTQLNIQPSVQLQYSLRTRLLPSYIADVLSADVPLADSILISSYDLNSPRLFTRLPVFPVSVEMQNEAGQNEVYEAIFTDQKNNILRAF